MVARHVSLRRHLRSHTAPLSALGGDTLPWARYLMDMIRQLLHFTDKGMEVQRGQPAQGHTANQSSLDLNPGLFSCKALESEIASMTFLRMVNCFRHSITGIGLTALHESTPIEGSSVSSFSFFCFLSNCLTCRTNFFFFTSTWTFGASQYVLLNLKIL